MYGTRYHRKFNHLVLKHHKPHSNDNNNERCYTPKLEPKPSNFYGFPKTHRSKGIQHSVKEQESQYIKLLRPKDLKPRPIIAALAC